jgi:peptidoglycan L-alanyl-D-glutamate endopeptidase CwlK
MQIINDINRLSPAFRKKFDPRWAEVKAKYPNAHVFETLRTQERQDWLYAQGRTRPGKIVTRTKKSNHADGNAVDIVFLDRNGNPTWS